MTVGMHTRVCVSVHSHVHICLWHLFPKSVCVSVEACAEATRIYVLAVAQRWYCVGALSFGFGDFLLGLCPLFPLSSPPCPLRCSLRVSRWASDNLTLFMESRTVTLRHFPLLLGIPCSLPGWAVVAVAWWGQTAADATARASPTAPRVSSPISCTSSAHSPLIFQSLCPYQVLAC